MHQYRLRASCHFDYRVGHKAENLYMYNLIPVIKEIMIWQGYRGYDMKVSKNC